MSENVFTSTFRNIRKFIWDLLFVIFYPVITTFSLLFMGIIWFFSTVSRLLSKLGRREESDIELKKPTWKPLISIGSYTIEKLFVTDILFGPTYYKYRSEPPIPAFDNIYFGDFYYKCFDGVLLQKWNSVNFEDQPDFTLVYLDANRGTMINIKRIPSFSWIVNEMQGDEVKIKWFNGTEGGEVIVNRNNLETSEIKI